jgi:hypothetical protein
MFAFPTNGGCRILKRRSLWGNCTVILAAKKKEISLSGGGHLSMRLNMKSTKLLWK